MESRFVPPSPSNSFPDKIKTTSRNAMLSHPSSDNIKGRAVLSPPPLVLSLCQISIVNHSDKTSDWFRIEATLDGVAICYPLALYYAKPPPRFRALVYESVFHGVMP